MLGERIASQSEVIRAIASGYGPCLADVRRLELQGVELLERRLAAQRLGTAGEVLPCIY